MKKVLLLLALSLGIQLGYAQRAVQTESTNKLFAKAKEMFADQNYIGTINTLEEYKKTAKDIRLVEETEFMLLSSHYYRGKKDIDVDLKDFLAKYSTTSHKDQLAFYTASVHFARKEWVQASYWLSRTDKNHLNISDQEDHSYRSAYSFLHVNNIESAKRLFGQLSKTSSKYGDDASYYLAYLDFQDKNYKKALPVFKLLRDKDKYREKATLFILQGEYLSGNLNNVIKEGEEYLGKYPKTDSSAEIYRIVANSAYRLGQMDKAISNYESYLTQEENPIRDDMYQLADAYYQSGQNLKTINTLKHVASSADMLGQAGNMMLGQAYLKLRDNAQALMAFDAAARVNYAPNLSEKALFNYVMLISKGSVSTFGESITALQTFLLSYPNSSYKGEVSSTLANTLLSVKNYKMALDVITKIKNPGVPILEAKQIILFQQGVQLFLDGSYDTASVSFTQAITTGSYDSKSLVESHFWRGDAAYRLGNNSDARKDFIQYAKLANSSDENYSLNLYNLAYTYFQDEEYNTALSSFKQYADAESNKKTANYADAMNRIGDCYLYNRKFSEAENYYASAASANPSSSDYAEFQKAFVLGLQRNYAGKVAALNTMMNKYPNSAYIDHALFEKSRALVMQDKETEAIKVIEELLREHPKTSLAPKAGVQLGQLYFNQNKLQEAINSYKKVITSYSNTDEARTAIKSMEGLYKEMNDITAYASYLKTLGKGNILSASRQDSLTYLAAENVYMKKNKEAAKTSFNNYLKQYPAGVFASDANFYLGNMAFEDKDTNSALSYFKEVIKTNNPKYMDNALIITSGIEFDKKDYDAAYKTYSLLNEHASSTANKHVAQLGMLRCSYLTNMDQDVVKSADLLLENKQLSSENINEALFYRGRSLKNLGRDAEAIADLSKVAKQARTAQAAQSQYLLAEIYYANADYDKAEKQVLDFMKAGSSYEYWMARAIIILSDTYNAKDDRFQAKQYLESLKANYKGAEADIMRMIDERLTKLN